VGLVRFELTIDGSLRHAHQCSNGSSSISVDPLFIICEHVFQTQRPLEPVAIPGLATTPPVMQRVATTDCTKSCWQNLSVVTGRLCFLPQAPCKTWRFSPGHS